MNEDYSKREIDHMFGDIKNDLKLIIEQTTRHNGRMSKMEEWRWYITGGMAVIVTFLLPILGWSLYQIVNFNDRIDDRIAKGIERALAEYEVEIR